MKKFYQSIRIITLCITGGLIAYICTYFYYSRVGYAEQDLRSAPVYFFSSPYSGGTSRSHFTCVNLYQPLIYIERLLGSSRVPASNWH